MIVINRYVFTAMAPAYISLSYKLLLLHFCTW